MPKEQKVAIDRKPILLADNNKIQSGEYGGKKLRLLTIYSDICSKCGNVYIYLITLEEIEMPRSPKNQAKIFMPGNAMNDFKAGPGIARN